MIARQFIAWYSVQKGTRPVGNGMIGSCRRAAIRTINQPWVRIRPSLRDGFSIGRVPGNKLPGYHHSVPPGRRYSREPLACPESFGRLLTDRTAGRQATPLRMISARCPRTIGLLQREDQVIDPYQIVS